MLKKSLIALAIAAASTSAFAADVMTESVVFSNQGTSAKLSATQAIEVKLNAEYKVDDIITLEFTGGDIDLTAAAGITLEAEMFDLGNSAATPPVPADTMVLGILDVTANKIVARVTSIDYNGQNTDSTKKATLTFANVKFKNSSILASSKLSVKYSAQTSTGITLDSAKGPEDIGNTATLVTTADQFVGKVVAQLDAVIDVNTQRLDFYNEVANEVKDVLTLSTSTAVDSDADPILFANPAVVKSVTYTVKGNFAFLGDVDATTNVVDTAAVKASAGTVTVYADHIEVATTVLGSTSITIDVSGTDADALKADSPIATQEFTATAVIGYEDTFTTPAKGTFNALTNAVAGEWTLNGALVHVPFMPFRDGYSPIVNVSNTSTQDGDIEVVVYAADNAWAAPKSYMLSVPAKAQAQTNITTALRNAGIKGDVAFDIIVNAPKDDIQVSALYYNAGDRAVMNTTKK